MAIIVIMGYHGGVFLTTGGYYSVDAFFTLSGFLITSLLISEWQSSGSIRLFAFWGRRARRLLPALMVMLAAVALYARFLAPDGSYPTLRSDGLSTLLYYANWHFIAIGSNYFGQSGLSSPLSHTWSLALEEQFYLVWPLIVLAIFRWTRSRWALLVICGAGALASAAEMAIRYSPTNVNRLYFGTDTRAQSLLTGAALAVGLSLWADRHRRIGSPSSKGGVHVQLGDNPDWGARTVRGKRLVLSIGIGGVVGSVLLWTLLATDDNLAFQGGFLLAALASAAVILSVACSEHSVLAVILSLSTLRFIGRISYGMYLWHLPLFFYLDDARTGLTGHSLFALRFAATAVVATASYFLVERPIRQGTFFQAWRGSLTTPIALTATAGILIATTAAPAAATGKEWAADIAIPTGPIARVLLVGDSMADTLGNGVNGAQQFYFGTALTLGSGIAGSPGRYFNLDIVNDGTPNCSIVPGLYQVQGNAPGGTRCSVPGWILRSGLGKIWSKEVRKVDPTVSVYLARLEIVDRFIGGHWTHIGQPLFDAYLLGRFRLAVKTLTSRGGKVILLTTPYYSSGEQPNGLPWPEGRAKPGQLLQRLTPADSQRLPGHGFRDRPEQDVGSGGALPVGGRRCDRPLRRRNSPDATRRLLVGSETAPPDSSDCHGWPPGDHGSLSSPDNLGHPELPLVALSSSYADDEVWLVESALLH